MLLQTGKLSDKKSSKHAEDQGAMSSRDAAKRAAQYAGRSGDNEHLASLSTRLVADLRQHISNIRLTDVYSDDWVDMAQVLERVATVVVAEDTFEKESKDTTLWESEEAALRFILEDSKMSVLVRMLQAFKDAQRETILSGDADALAARDANADAAGVYERALSTILAFGLFHAEVVETVDITMLLTIVKDSLEFAVAMPDAVAERLHGTLEAKAFSIVDSVVRRCEDTSEERVMPALLDLNVLPICLRFLHLHADKLSDVERGTALRAMAAVVDTEAFGISEAAYLGDEAEAFLALHDLVLEAYDMDPEAKRALRPLADEIKRQKRRLVSK